MSTLRAPLFVLRVLYCVHLGQAGSWQYHKCQNFGRSDMLHSLAGRGGHRSYVLDSGKVETSVIPFKVSVRNR